MTPVISIPVSHWASDPFGALALLASILWLSPRVPVALGRTFMNSRALLNLLRRQNVFGLDRRTGQDRRQSLIGVQVERRSGSDRRSSQPPPSVSPF
jgi:hypothetical protein